MKLPFTFGTALIFRLVLPGFILAATWAPLVHTMMRWAGIAVPLASAFPVEVVLWGWAVVLADQPIYMLYEGRRFWPQRLWQRGQRRETKRLDKLKPDAVAEMLARDPRRYREANIKLLGFPLGKDGEPEARFPTRLGNLLTAYETYPSRAYDLDAIFYWSRLWIVLDKDLRAEVDNSQAVADSGVYVSFALAISALVLVGYAAFGAVAARWLPAARLVYVPPPVTLLVLAGGCAAVAVACYRVALFAQEQYGELFKALFDQFRGKLDFVDDVAKRVGRLSDDPHAALRQPHEKYRIVARFLRWHRLHPPGETKVYTPEAWQRERARRACAASAAAQERAETTPRQS